MTCQAPSDIIYGDHRNGFMRITYIYVPKKIYTIMKMKVRKPSQKEIELTSAWGTWSKEVSAFPWSYDDRETCYVLEGSATVTDGDGNSISFEKGDWVEFETGLECTWKVERSIRKKYKFG